MLLFLVSRWESEATSSLKVTGAVGEEATEPTSESIPTSGQLAHVYAIYVRLSPQGPIFCLPPLIIKISRFEVHLRGFLCLR